MLKRAFVARNEIAHELDITKPKADVRARLETLQKRRSIGEIQGYVKEIINVGQLVINDVSGRLRVANYEQFRQARWEDITQKS